MSDVYQDSVELHKTHGGKIELVPKIDVNDSRDLSLVYTPGVAQVSREIAADKDKSFELTWRGETVAIVSDGTAVLGLGDIGPEAALPVMEGKAMLLTRFGKVSAVPIVTHATTEDELVKFVEQIAPSFGAINLEDIAAPTCLAVEDRLQNLGIPVFHDDQHGTAIVVSAAIKNAAKVVGKRYEDLKVVISGAGAAGLAISQMLLGVERVEGELRMVEGATRVAEVKIVDSRGIISSKRDDLNLWKSKFAAITNTDQQMGGLADAVENADVFVGVSKGGLLKPEMVSVMSEKAIVFAMANPEPEISPEIALAAGAYIVGTGRSDYPNQINNSLAFPGLFKGLLSAKATRVSVGIKQVASEALASMVEPSRDKILPSMFDEGVAERVASAVAKQVEREGLVR